MSAALLVVAAGASMAVGARPSRRSRSGGPSPTSPAPTDHLVVRDIRLPRTILGVCVGAALGAAGVLIQTLTRNPLAEPGILGVTAGAGFAINLGVLAGVAGSQAGQLVLAVAGPRSPPSRSTPSGGPHRCGWSWPASRWAGC